MSTRQDAHHRSRWPGGSRRWTMGFAALALAAVWLRRSRRRRISVDRVSEQWLMQHEFDAGKEH